MKSLLTIFTLLFTVIFSSTSFGGWTKVGKSRIGSTFYVDFERIRKQDGYVYWWDMVDMLKPNKFGDLSSKLYKQGDCKLFRFKILSFSFHKEPMGGGTSERASPRNPEWGYPSPNSINETILNSVCSR